MRRIALDAATVADELLAATAPEGGASPVQDARAVLRDVGSALRPRAALQQKKISVRATGGLALPIPRGWLGAAVRNLVENALAASPPGSIVRIEGRSEGGRVRVEVRDRGKGQPDVWTRRPRRGWGLRLVRQIVEEVGGEVFAEARRGGGLVVGFLIPARKTGPAS